MNQLLTRLNDKRAVIGIIGVGYVGLPLVLRYSEVGFSVIGFDVDGDKVDALNQGESYIEHIGSTQIASALASGFEASSDFSKVAQCDALIICVPTPLDRYREPNLSYVTGTLDRIVPYLRENQAISLESTTYPGTTEEVLLPRIESSGLSVGQDIALVYSPEREDPGNVKFSTQSIPKVCAGHTKKCCEVGVSLYQQAFDTVVPVSSTKVAEMSKLLENIYRSVNIGLVNEMKIVADKMGIDIHEVISAAATKPFGFTPFYPGPGLGGHCIPIDPFYLTWKAREYGLHTRFIELAGELNSSMPEWVMGKVVAALNEKRLALNGSKILILGVAYKKNVDDVRESPAIKLMQLLQSKGAVVSYSDPHVPVFKKMRNYHFDLASVALSEQVLAVYDAVVLATDHDEFDYEMLQKHSKILVDTRGKFSTSLTNIVPA